MISQLHFLHQKALGSYIDALYAFQEERRTTGSVRKDTAAMLEWATRELARIEEMFLSPYEEKKVTQGVLLSEQASPVLPFPRKFRMIKGGKK